MCVLFIQGIIGCLDDRDVIYQVDIFAYDQSIEPLTLVPMCGCLVSNNMGDGGAVGWG